ncbi:hypothetical protein C6379_22755, partial [Pseudomonas syringae pv. actinidiae]
FLGGKVILAVMTIEISLTYFKIRFLKRSHLGKITSQNRGKSHRHLPRQYKIDSTQCRTFVRCCGCLSVWY